LLAERAKSDFLRVHQDLSLKFYLTESHNIVNLHKKWKNFCPNALHAAGNWLLKNRDGRWFCAAGPAVPSIP
jgi:hypothetical protein